MSYLTWLHLNIFSFVISPVHLRNIAVKPYWMKCKIYARHVLYIYHKDYTHIYMTDQYRTFNLSIKLEPKKNKQMNSFIILGH